MAGLGPVLKHGLLSRSMIEVRDSISVRQLHSYCQRLIGASLLLLFLLLVFLFFLSLPIFLHPKFHDTSLPRPPRPHHPITICFQGDASIMVQPGSFHPPIMGHMGASHQEARHLAICSFFIPYVIIMSNKASGCFIYLPHLLRSRGALTRILYTEVTPFWLSAGVSSDPFAPCLIHNSKLT